MLPALNKRKDQIMEKWCCV